MLDFREALGYKKSTYEAYLKHFIHFCGKHYEHSPCITKQMVLEWIRIRPSESINTRNRRIIALVILQNIKHNSLLGI